MNDKSDKTAQYLRYWRQFKQTIEKQGWTVDVPNGWKQDHLKINARPRVDWYRYIVRDDHSIVEYGLDVNDPEMSRALFMELEMNRDPIELAFGDELQWDLHGRGKGSIRFTVPRGIASQPEEEWPRHQQSLFNSMRRLQKALVPYLPSGKI